MMRNMGKGTCRVGKAEQECQQGPGRLQQMQWSGRVFREGIIWAKSSRRKGGLASGYVGEASFRKRKQLGLMCLVYSKNNVWLAVAPFKLLGFPKFSKDKNHELFAQSGSC